MSSSRSTGERSFQKPFQGCMASMINIFDLSAGMAGTKLLTDKPHANGSAVERHHPILVKNPIGVVVNQTQDKQIVSNQGSTHSIKKSGGTPMKTLIAQELSKDAKYKQKSPTVVARLMGLDYLPLEQSPLTDKKHQKLVSSCDGLAGVGKNSRWQEDEHFHNQVRFPPEKKVYKDVHEVWQQPMRTKTRDKSTQKEKCDENSYQTTMALVREKFIEAKRLATDEKFLQSKEFQDAIEILSSNRDLFLKFLEEPNSLFWKHFHGLQNFPQPPQTSCITVLKTLNSIEENGEKGSGKELHEASEDKSIGKTHEPSWSSNVPDREPEILSQPTRIVVLKPSPGEPYDIKKAGVALPVSSTKLLEGRGSFGAFQTDATGSRELAKEITRRIRENLSGHRRTGDLLSSVLANGYVGDESSFNRTESEYAEEEAGSLSDSDIATPTSRNSWDFLNRNGSPYSLSSFSRASHSPESSVTREAKKRLSERLALVASGGNGLEQIRRCRSSSTLGEMLAIPGVEKQEELNATSSRLSSEGQGLESLSPIIPHMNSDCNGNNSPRELSRSKSVPVSSAVFEVTELDVAVSSSLITEPVIMKEVPKSKNVKSSFKGKLSNLFFSRNKKQNKDEPTLSSLVHSDDRLQAAIADVKPGGKADVLAEPLGDIFPAQSISLNPDEITASCTTSVDEGSDAVSLKDALSFQKHTCGNIIQDQDQPSPISVLEAPFADGAKISLSQSFENGVAGHPQALSRSPPIESVARSLPRNKPYLVTTSPCLIKSSRILSKADEEHEQFVFVEHLVSSAGLNEKETSFSFARWYALDIPLNPMLLHEFAYMKDNEGNLKYKEKLWSERLLFDCVNAALLDMSLKTTLASYPWTRECNSAQDDCLAGAAVTEVVWGIIKSWCCFEDGVVECNNTKTVVDAMVKTEVTGRQWAESMWLEMNEFSKEVGGKLLEELVEEALS